MSERKMIYSERVDHYRMEVYPTKPYLRFRDLITGRFVKRPPKIWMLVLCGAETGGGGEPIEVELMRVEPIDVDYLSTLPPDQIDDMLYEIEKEIENKLYLKAGEYFGYYIASMLEKKARELRWEAEEITIIRWRHKKRYKSWREITE